MVFNANEEASKIKQKGYEKLMPQSQLWFIDHKLSSQSTTNRKNYKEANMFPAVAKLAG